jgi:DNA repair protein RadC
METERGTPSGFSIKQWAEDDRPREKLLSKGRHVLSDAELIAILIGSGTKEASAVQLAQEILRSVSFDLNALGRLNVNRLTRFKGIGQARAITIMAALELGRRRKDSERNGPAKITCSKDAFEQLYPHLADLQHEEFFLLLLNRSNTVVQTVKVSQGGVSGTVADAKIIFNAALEQLASGIILAHNHPSGNLQPSQADLSLTRRLVEAGKLLDIAILDHIIIAGKAYYSFADEGQL